jgi:SAM-dependent methyltransferase
VRGHRSSSRQFDKIIPIKWFESDRCYQGLPSGKVTRCLLEELSIEPDESLFHYQINPQPNHVRAAKNYLEKLPPSKGVVLIHYQGTSSADKKNLSHEDIREICRYLIRYEYLPVILDWDYRSPLPDQRTIFCPDKNQPMWGATGTGCLATLTSLISQARLFIGVDSGPLHAAGATQTPAIGVWTKNHPVHFYELSHVKHILPKDHRRYIRHRDRALAEEYFQSRYRHAVYSDLRTGIMDAIAEQLHTPVYNGNPMAEPKLLKSTAYNRDYYEQHLAAGCDYAAYGDWQTEYGQWLADCMGWRNKNVLDVGCACGAITKGLNENGCLASGVDINEFTVGLGRNLWPELPLFVADAVNLHHFENGQFDGLHSHQVFEHLRPELVPFVLAELRRVSKPGAALFVVLDTEDSFSRQNRLGAEEDPTHVCIRPMSWWSRMLDLSGWDECKKDFQNAMQGHSRNFLSRYDWDWFAARRRA